MTKGLYRYETAYACEGKTLKIECNEGELIKLIRANYGRFSIAICNDHGHTDWSVNCMSPKSLRVLHGRCSQNQNCSIPASTSMFGDPCPGTHKYLEAHYQCLPAATTTTTNRPSPPWLITSQSPMWSTVKPSARPPIKLPPQFTEPPSLKPSVTFATSVPNTTVLKPLPPIYPPSDIEPPEVIKEEKGFSPKEVTISSYTTFPPRRSTSKHVDVQVTHTFKPNIVPFWGSEADALNFCSPATVRTLFWNWTRVNTVNVQACPEGTTGYARWRCVQSKLGIPQWFTKTPDLSGCKSVWLNSFDQRIQSGKEPLASITNDLVQVASSKALYGGDMMITTKIIKALTRKTAQDIQTFHDSRDREAFVTDMLKDVVNTSSYLIGNNALATWNDLSYEDQMSVASSLLIGLEENAFLLADTLSREKIVDQVFQNIMLSIRVLETRQVATEKFPQENQWNDGADSIEIPKGALIDNSDGGLVRLVFVAFNGLEEILQWRADAAESLKNISKVLNSKVICASLGKGRHIQLKEPVSLTFKHLHIENVTNPSCVFWDYSMNSWSNEGCFVKSTNATHTMCLCNHLTNFAILMDVEELYLTLPFPHQIALEVITYVGCVISIVCLILAITVFQVFRGLKSDRTTIHCNLCFCLLVAELLFLLGIEQTQDELTCGIIAGALHFFFLCAFAWMFFEGFQLYVMLVEVFEAEKSRLRWYYLFAYGTPFVIVLISAIIYPQGYGTDKFCWLKTENYFIYSFIGPVSLVLALNLVFLSLAIVKMCIHANNSVSMKNKEHSRLASTRIWLKGAVILVFLLGLTWTFGFLYVNKESVIIAYIFSGLNSLQGFFIFLFHCLQNEKVRKEYKKFIRRHSWLPRCLRCSKSSTGVNSLSGSSGLGKERRTSIYAGSNGNPSGSHSTESPHGTSVGTNIVNNLNNLARPTPLVQVNLNNASTTTMNHRQQQEHFF